MNCEGCSRRFTMDKMTVVGEGWNEKWLCNECTEEWKKKDNEKPKKTIRR